MQSILGYIDDKKETYAQIPFFAYLKDKNIDIMQKLAFAPCAAPFVMGFGELNKSVLRDESSTDPLQAIINHHTQQDAHHWIWFLEDLEKLGFNPNIKFRDTLNTLWSEESAATRQLIYELYRLTYQAPPLQKLVVIETIEATGNVFLDVTSPFVNALEIENQERYRYFGSLHLTVETGHTYCSPEEQDYIDNLEITAADYAEQLRVVDQVFDAFIAFNNELLAYAQKHPISDAAQEQPMRIGRCLVDAGVVTTAQLDQALAEQRSKPARLGEILAGHGWVKQQTIEYLMTHVMQPLRDQQTSVFKPLAFSH